MRFVSNAVALLLAFVETGKATEYIETGDGAPHNWMNYDVGGYGG